MKKLMLLTVLAAILAGCKSKEFKSTPLYEGTDIKYVGDAHDRVNLWPIAYWHNPVGSIAWPVVSFSDDLFALRPVYSQYKQNGAKGEYDEFNFLWPIAQADTKHNDYRIFPVFWGESCKRGEYYQTIFPLYFNGPEYNVLFRFGVIARITRSGLLPRSPDSRVRSMVRIMTTSIVRAGVFRCGTRTLKAFSRRRFSGTARTPLGSSRSVIGITTRSSRFLIGTDVAAAPRTIHGGRFR